MNPLWELYNVCFLCCKANYPFRCHLCNIILYQVIMKAISRSKSRIYNILFLLLILVCLAACKQENKLESSNKKIVFEKKNNEEIEAYFFIATASISKSIISKSQIAQQKCRQKEIQSLSKRIENDQSHLLEDITKMANKRLIIITDINESTVKKDLYQLIDTAEVHFDKAYINSITASLSEQIELLESISKETKDESILKLVLSYLPQQYILLRETKKIKEEIS
jgi:predicted outer membrane protein